MLKLQQLSKQNVSEGNFTNWDGRVVKNDVLIVKPKSLSEVVQIVKAAKQLSKLLNCSNVIKSHHTDTQMCNLGHKEI